MGNNLPPTQVEYGEEEQKERTAKTKTSNDCGNHSESVYNINLLSADEEDIHNNHQWHNHTRYDEHYREAKRLRNNGD